MSVRGHDDEKYFSNVIEQIADSHARDVDDEKTWDRATSLFLRLAEKAADEKKLIFRVLRHGVQFLVQTRMCQKRKIVMRQHNGVKDRQKERKTRSAEQQKSRRAETEAYVREHGIPKEDVASHKMNVAFKKFEETIEWEAQARARTILSSWVCADGKRLAKCTSDDLARLSSKHKSISEGQLRTAKFYEALIEHIPKNGTVGNSVNPGILVKCFDAAFPTTLPHAPTLPRPRLADDSNSARQCESSPLSHVSTGKES